MLEDQARAARVEGVSEYVDRLEDKSPKRDEEFQQIVSRWTNNESFFFRDDGQIALIQDQLIPSLVDTRASKRKLTVWSAGCSTGEEVYTLAILLHEGLPHGWEAEVVGTDIDEQALDQAREAVYSGAAFRRTPDEKREVYFEPCGSGSRPIEPIRSMTRFKQHNLVEDQPPDEVRSCDLILCRNVFIYFDTEAVQRVARTFTGALSPGGFLVTGHTEMMGVDLDGLASRVLPGSIVYERAPGESAPARLTETTRSPLTPTHSPSKPEEPDRRSSQTSPKAPTSQPAEPETHGGPAEGPDEPDPLKRVRSLLAKGAPRQALEALKVDPLDEEAPPPARLLAAQAEANLGNLDQAHEIAEAVLDAHPFDAEAHLLRARLALEEGDRDAARTHLERVIYVDDTRLEGYIELAWIYEDEGLPERAQRMRATALDLLEQLDSEASVPAYPDTTAAELADHLRTVLDRTAGSTPEGGP